MIQRTFMKVKGKPPRENIFKTYPTKGLCVKYSKKKSFNLITAHFGTAHFVH